MAKIKVQAQHLKPGDIVGSGECVAGVGAGTRTPKGKVEVLLDSENDTRLAIWGKYTMIGVERAE